MQGGSLIGAALIFIPRGKGAYVMKTRGKKRIVILLFVLVVVVFTSFAFTACGAKENQPNSNGEQTQQSDETPDYEEVEISTKNYSEYLTIGIELADSNIEYIGQNALGLDRYVLSCVGNIEISKTGNFQFESVTVLCGVIVQGWHDGMISANIELNYDGEGRYSFNLSKESSSNKFDLTSRDCNVSVYGAKGKVRIYE